MRLVINTRGGLSKKMENIPQIQSYQKMVAWDRVPDRRMLERKRKKRSVRNTRSRLFSLSRMADDTHTALVMKNSPIRLCVYQEGDDLVMDVMAKDPVKKKQHLFTRLISNDSLSDITRQIHNQQGLVLDYRL